MALTQWRLRANSLRGAASTAFLSGPCGTRTAPWPAVDRWVTGTTGAWTLQWMRGRRPASPRRPLRGGGRDPEKLARALDSSALPGLQADRSRCTDELAAGVLRKEERKPDGVLLLTLQAGQSPGLHRPGCCGLPAPWGRPEAPPYARPRGTGPGFSRPPLPATPRCLTRAARPPQTQAQPGDGHDPGPKEDPSPTEQTGISPCLLGVKPSSGTHTGLASLWVPLEGGAGAGGVGTPGWCFLSMACLSGKGFLSLKPTPPKGQLCCPPTQSLLDLGH